MDSFEAKPVELLDAVTAEADAVLSDLRSVLRAARNAFGEADRREIAREVRKHVANACAEVDWILLDKLHQADAEVLQALCALEPDPGATFRTTGLEIWRAQPTRIAFSVVYVALRRLAHLGLIEWTPMPGNRGSRVRLIEPAKATA